ncbi:MAG: MMPL family transporter [Paludibacteraceae bacterium]|nr:MMPL family transporter [Paludibacteraceae bacterium]
MSKLFTFFRNHKDWLYTIITLTVFLFAAIAMQCRFEENIAKLLPPTSDNLTVDLAFADLKVKDKIFIQAIATSPSTDDNQALKDSLQQAMDTFMNLLNQNEHASEYLSSSLYQLPLEQLLELAPWLLQHAPQYLDFTDQQMDSLTSVTHIQQQIEQYLTFLDTELGMQLYDYIAYDPAGILIAQLKPLLHKTSTNTIYNQHLFSADGTVCYGFLTPATGSMDSGKAGKLLNDIQQAKKQTEASFQNITILYHGAPIQSANNAKRIKKDLWLTIGVALLLILTILAFALKNIWSNILLLMPVLYGALFALAAIFIFKGGMSVMALGIGAIVMGVALSYCLHLIIHNNYTNDPLTTVKEQTQPILLSAITTIGAFAGLLFTQSSLLQDFGFFAMLTIIGTTIACLTFMPHFLQKNTNNNTKKNIVFHLIERINSFDPSQYITLIILTVIATGICIYFSPRVHFDSNLKNIGYTDPEVQLSIQTYQNKQQQGNFQQYFAAVSSDLEQTLQQLYNIEQTCDSLQQQGIIQSFTRMSAIMPSAMQQQQRINHWQQYFTPQKVQQVWQNVQTACMNADIDTDFFLPFKQAMTDTYQPEYIYQSNLIPQALLSNLIEQTNGYYLAFLPVRMNPDNVEKVNDILTQNAHCLVLDPFYYTIDSVAMMQNDFQTILTISALFVLLVLILSFRRLTLALIAFLPMALSWYIVLGIMYLTQHQFNLINIVISTFIFGIGVDYSIFMMDGLLKQTKGENTQLLQSHKTAIILSALILIICMISLLFAVHPAIQSIGFASLVGMISTLWLTYTIQPFLLRLTLKIPFLKKHIL